MKNDKSIYFCKLLKCQFIVLMIFFLSLGFIHSDSYAQKYSTKSQRAIKYFKQALDAYKQNDSKDAFKWINKALKEDSRFVEPHLLKAELFIDQKKFDKVIAEYQKAIDIAPDYKPRIYYTKANVEFIIGKYKDAKQSYLKFLTFDDIKEKERLVTNSKIEKCNIAIGFMDNPVPFEPKNLGENINTSMNEYWPTLTIDEQTLIFTRLIPKQMQLSPFESSKQEDFYVSNYINNQWSEAKNLGAPMNTPQNEGAQSISADGRTMVFTACNRMDGYGKCDIYYSRKTGEKWTQPKNIGPPINTAHWESQPSLSADGKTLYFISNRPGGKGNNDIWVSTLNDLTGWQTPVNISDSINTPGDETSPFIHPDGETLYFTSDGHPGMGETDIFMSRKQSDGKWLRPKNLGYPINSHHAETALIVNGRGELAFFATNRLNGYGGLDIYAFELYKDVRPQPVTYIKGKVFDAVTKKPLRAKFELIQLETSSTIIESFSDHVSGQFLVTLPSTDNFALNVSKTGYMFYSDHFALHQLEKDSAVLNTYLIDIPLQPIQIGRRVVLRNIFFDTDKYILKPESNAELNKLVSFLKSNPTISIEISGHTDTQGGKEHNEELSLNRAKAVYNYLIENGIESERLSYAGYGYTQPIATNETAKGRALNRRTEFKIMK